MRIPLSQSFGTFLTGLLLFAGLAQALPEDRKQTLYVDAGQCVFDVRNNESRCQQGMQVRQGSLEIDAAEGTVFRQGKRIIRIELRGTPAVFRQILNPEDGVLEARALYMDYRKAEGILVLKGQVVVKNPNLGTFSGEEMVINLNTQEITGGQGSGDKRVHMVVEGEDESKQQTGEAAGKATPSDPGKPVGSAADKTGRRVKQADGENSEKPSPDDTEEASGNASEQPQPLDDAHD